MTHTLITGGTIVNEGKIYKADILIFDDIISDIYPYPLSAETKHFIDKLPHQIIDAKGLHVFPGIIDDQVHFREPGNTHKGDIESESRAAIAGGVTSFMEMPNTNPQTTSIEEWNKKNELGCNKSYANYSFYFGASNDNIKEINKINSKEVCGLKVFMGSSTGNMLVDNKKSLEAIFSESPVLIATHCEDEATILINTEKAKKEFGDNIPVEQHSIIRNNEACYKSSSLAAELATKYNSRLHILHLTTKEELSIFDEKPIEQKQITGEVCVHHLWFNDKDYKALGSKIKCNPAIKTELDRENLIQGVLNNRLDVIATDHAPHTLEEKANIYSKSPSGVPLVQHSLQIMIEFYHKQIFTLEKIIEKMCHAPALAYKIQNRGFIKKGYFADLVLVDLNKSEIVDKKQILYKCNWSPFEGMRLNSSINTTIINGKISYSKGSIQPNRNVKMLLFNR
ncbi:MAG: dihydroorotase [Bacteroidota bacterium]